jgi:hypothetical protein
MGVKNKSINPISNYTGDGLDPFMGGKEKVISMTSRPLDRSKNISDVEFSAVISRDPSQYKNNLSSLRSYASINATIVQTGATADISSFIKQRRSLNHRTSLSKLINIKQNNNDTIHEILADFGQASGTSLKTKSQLNKIYHMSAYDVVKEPDIVTRNKNKFDKNKTLASADFSRHIKSSKRSGNSIVGPASVNGQVHAPARK